MTDKVRVTERKHVAAGLPAVLTTVKHAVGEMGPVAGLRTLAKVNQKGGFDCPSCAWPDPEGDRSFAEFCENGAKAVADAATRKRVTPEFFAEHSIAQLAERDDMWLNQQGRLTRPMHKASGDTHYRAVGWAHAFDIIADHLNQLESPNEAVFYTSGRTSNEAAFLYQLFARQFGTNNLPDCSNMCHESSGTALTEVIGIGKGTVTLEDFDHAELILVVGQNPGTNHPRMLSALERSKRRGATIVSINPLPETGTERFKNPQDLAKPGSAMPTLAGPGTRLADLFLPVRIGGDLALFKGIAKTLVDADAIDRGFVRTHTEGFDAFVADLATESWTSILDETGLSREEIGRVADLIARYDRIIACWAMGLTQHKHAVGTIQSIVNVLLMRGAIGKPGAGACPVRGHSNVQGDRTMGIWEKPPAWIDRLGEVFGFDPPKDVGVDTVNAIRALHAGRAHVFVGLGGNFLSAAPDTEFTAAALRQCALTVQISTKLNRAHLVTGDEALILPCLARTESDVQAGGEQFASVENSMGVVHATQGTFEPASPWLMSEPAIVAGLAAATLKKSSVDWSALACDYDLIREAIAQVVPGFHGYNHRVRHPGGFLLANSARDREWETESGRAGFRIHAIPQTSLADGQLVMMTMRSHDQFNTTIYGQDDRYRGVFGGRRVVFLHPEDIAERRLAKGDRVNLVSHFEGEQRIARGFTVVPYEIPRRSAATYFPEANVLVPVNSTADRSNTPTSKSIIITIEPA